MCKLYFVYSSICLSLFVEKNLQNMRIHVIDSDKHDAKILKSQLSEGMGDCLDSLSVYATWQAFIENEIIKDQFTVVFFFGL